MLFWLKFILSFLCIPNICCLMKIKCCFSPSSFTHSNNRFSSFTSFCSNWHILTNFSFWFPWTLTVNFHLTLVLYCSVIMYLSFDVLNKMLFQNSHDSVCITSHFSWLNWISSSAKQNKLWSEWSILITLIENVSSFEAFNLYQVINDGVRMCRYWHFTS